MKVRKVTDCIPYQAAGHFNMVPLRLQGKEESGCEKFWMGMSHFLPGGGAEYDASPTEKVYFVLEGEITVYSEGDKEKFVLKKNDSIHIGANEGRRIMNESNYTTTMLVVINYPN